MIISSRGIRKAALAVILAISALDLTACVVAPYRPYYRPRVVERDYYYDRPAYRAPRPYYDHGYWR